MAFNQRYGHVENVYNVEGTLVLTGQSSPSEFREQLTAVREQVSRAPGLDEAQRAEVAQELSAAEEKAASPQGRAADIKGHLDRAGKILESAATLTTTAGKFAKTVFALGTWAAAAFS